MKSTKALRPCSLLAFILFLELRYPSLFEAQEPLFGLGCVTGTFETLRHHCTGRGIKKYMKKWNLLSKNKSFYLTEAQVRQSDFLILPMITYTHSNRACRLKIFLQLSFPSIPGMYPDAARTFQQTGSLLQGPWQGRCCRTLFSCCGPWAMCRIVCMVWTERIASWRSCTESLESN